MSLITIIVPCYNYGWVLAETLDSLLAQTYQQWECIIVDDGSTDNTRAVAEAYQARDSRFCYVYQANSGLSATRNHGLRLATGSYIQFLDADDLIAPTKLAVQVAYLENHPKVDLVYGDVRYFMHGSPNVLSRSLDMRDFSWVTGVQGAGEELLAYLLKGNIMVVTAPLVRINLVKKVGFFTEDLRSMEDWDFWLRSAMAAARFAYIDSPETWSLVRVHPSSMSQDLTKMYKYELIVRDRLQKKMQLNKMHTSLAIGRQSMDATVEALGDLARRKVAHGDLSKGIEDYWFLAKITKKYSFYLKTTLYWLRNRSVMDSVAK